MEFAYFIPPEYFLQNVLFCFVNHKEQKTDYIITNVVLLSTVFGIAISMFYSTIGDINRYLDSLR